MQRHEREALTIITEVAGALGLETHVLPTSKNPHMQVDIVNPATGKKGRVGVSCSPKNRDHTLKAVRREVVKACRLLLEE